MPLRLEIKKEMTVRSDRVKSVDVYPEEHPWVLAALYNGNVCIYDYSIDTYLSRLSRLPFLRNGRMILLYGHTNRNVGVGLRNFRERKSAGRYYQNSFDTAKIWKWSQEKKQ